MTCTRCGSRLDVEQTTGPERTARKRRRDIRRISQATEYVVRRRRCVGCGQVVHTVEVEITDPAPAP
jgi:hypothetical protein